MILTCEHFGRGHKDTINIRHIGSDRIVRSGALYATLDDVHPEARGSGRREPQGSVPASTVLSVRCRICKVNLRARWDTWLGFWVRIQDAGHTELDLRIATRTYEAVASSLHLEGMVADWNASREPGDGSTL